MGKRHPRSAAVTKIVTPWRERPAHCGTVIPGSRASHFLTRRPILGAVSAIALAVAVAACSSGGKSGGPRLRAGSYTWTSANVLADQCWPTDAIFPPQSVPFAIDVGTAGGAVQLVVTTNAALLLPHTLAGAQAKSLVQTTGASPFVVSSGCTLQVSAAGDATVSAPTAADLRFDVTLSAATTASNGAHSQCLPYAGGTYPGTSVPFPSLVPGTDGSCTFSLSGPLTETTP